MWHCDHGTVLKVEVARTSEVTKPTVHAMYAHDNTEQANNKTECDIVQLQGRSPSTHSDSMRMQVCLRRCVWLHDR
eukprot:15459474-Alexandrium_andersonii.AAC.1